jgi:hypothetical protein
MNNNHEEFESNKNRKNMRGPIVMVIITFGLVALLLLASPR